MEDVWKDISLASLCDHNSPAAGNSATTNDRAALRGFIFQDFLAAASTKLAPASGLAAAPPPTTLLCLSSSGSDQHQIQSTATFITNTSAPVKPNPQRLHGTSSTSSSLISFSANNLSVALDCKKRAVEESGDNSRRVRHRRMIKNRESASRSRARKQAYTNELELELAHLQVENARLKRQQAKFSVASPAAAASTSRLLKKAHSL